MNHIISDTLLNIVIIGIYFGLAVWLFKIPGVAEFVYRFFPPRRIYETVDQIRGRGIPCESHEVTTEDGYVLRIFRMYRSLPPTGEVVLLQHGLLSNSTDWVLFDGSIAFQLVDLGWDVWLGNSRGNSYCRKHVELSLESRQFWEYSFHELGTKDLPAVIDHILQTTNAGKIAYIGHSQGCAAFFAMASSIPEMNDKVKVMFALSPVCGIRDARTKMPLLYRISIIDRMGPNRSFLQTMGLRRKLGGFEPIRPLFQPFANIFIDVIIYPIANWLLSGAALRLNCCDPHPDIIANCFELFCLLRLRNGMSALQLKHFAQSLANDYYFHQLDHGRAGNLRVYGRRHPPAYDVKKITTHVSLVWGREDTVVVPTDLKRLHDKLPNKSVLLLHNCRHLDFTCSTRQTDKIVNHVVSTARDVSVVTPSKAQDTPGTRDVQVPYPNPTRNSPDSGYPSLQKTLKETDRTPSQK